MDRGQRGGTCHWGMGHTSVIAGEGDPVTPSDSLGYCPRLPCSPLGKWTGHREGPWGGWTQSHKSDIHSGNRSWCLPGSGLRAPALGGQMKGAGWASSLGSPWFWLLLPPSWGPCHLGGEAEPLWDFGCLASYTPHCLLGERDQLWGQVSGWVMVTA